VKTPEEAQKIAEKMLGQTLVTKQTGEEGKVVSTVLVSEFVEPKKQYYFAITMDRASGGPVLIGSSEGGVDIEGVAHKDPNAIKRVPLHPDGRNEPAKYLELARLIGIPEKHREQAADVFERLYTIFRELDATMVEINPLAEIADGSVMAFDAKFNFDDNAAQRQVSIFNMRDPTQEVQRKRIQLDWISGRGEIYILREGYPKSQFFLQ
jgi:succinyl-CoA synthetase beta subunit